MRTIDLARRIGQHELLMVAAVEAEMQSDRLAAKNEARGPERLSLPSGVRTLTLALRSLTSDHTFLASKLHIPHHNNKLVPRPRLVALLNSRVKLPVCIVCAPPGFGKTTLVSEWAAKADCAVAWLSLASSDNDPLRFWAYFVGALQGLKSNLGEEALSVLQPSDTDYTDFIATLLNEIDVFGKEFVLVLDDYQSIESTVLHSTIALLMDHMPQHMHLVIVTRHMPPLPLARLCANGQMHGIGTLDLSFTAEEVREFLSREGVVGLSAKESKCLQQKTEGWIAGLRLAALSMEGKPDIAGLLSGLTGSHRLIADYLTEEVLRQQPAGVRDFLLKTAILDRLCASVCAAVLGEEESSAQAALEQLERGNAFVVALDEDRQWYRYHHLFSDLLRGKLRQIHPELVPELCHRASLWYEQHGWIMEAVKMAFSGHDFARAARLIEAGYRSSVTRGEAHTLLKWVEALPSAMVREQPRLSLAKAWACAPLGRLREAEQCLQDAEYALNRSEVTGRTGPEAQSMLGEVAAVRALIATTLYEAPRIITTAQEALALLPPEQGFLRGLVSLSLGVAYAIEDDPAAARHALTATVELEAAAGNSLVAYLGRYYLAEIANSEGNLHEAAELLRAALQLARTKSGAELPMAGLAHIALARLLYEWNDLEGAISHANTGISLSKSWWVKEAVRAAHITLARARRAQGDLAAAVVAIRQATDLWEGKHHAPLDTQVAIADMQFWMHSLHTNDRVLWAEKEAHSFQVTDTLGNVRKWRKMMLVVRILLAADKVALAARLLEPLMSAAEARGMRRHVTEVLVLRVLALLAQGDTAQGSIALNRALAQAEPEGYVRLFVDELPLLPLLRLAKRQGVAPAYVVRLLAAGGEPTLCLSGGGTAHLGSLSEREREILRLIAAGLSPQDVADQLVIAVGTVRNHLKNIYAKLETHTRLQAVLRARELNLL